MSDMYVGDGLPAGEQAALLVLFACYKRPVFHRARGGFVRLTNMTKSAHRLQDSMVAASDIQLEN